MSTMQKVPQRKFVIKRNTSFTHVKNPSTISMMDSRLPSSVPIIGIGGSAFSTFFLAKPSMDLSDTACLTVETVHKNHPKIQEWISLIKYAIHRGITLIDSAAWYGHGLSEIVIGYALDEILHQTTMNKITRKDLIINTKIGRYDVEPTKQFDYSYDRTIQATQLSIQRMNCLYIDILQLHDPEYSPSIQLLLDETIPAMIYCRDELKLCKALGITGYPLHVQHEILIRSAQILQNCTHVTTFPSIVFDTSLTYCHFNLHDSTLFTSNIYTNPMKTPDVNSNSFMTQEDSSGSKMMSFATFCYENSIGLMAAAPYSMGLLTTKGPQAWHPASMDLQVACKETVLYCNQHQIHVSSLALLYALSQSAIACTIVGMGSVEEVDHACTIACRFSNLQLDDYDDGNTIPTPQDILRRMLTDSEYNVLTHILDPNNGPFADVYKRGLYQWDGINIAAEFWDQILGGAKEAEFQMRLRRSKK